MPLPSSGSMSLGANVNVELGNSATTQIALGQESVRTLYGIPSGQIRLAADGYGKSNAFAFTISSNTTNANLRTLAVNAGWNQSSPVTATVASNVYVYSTSTGTPGLTINGSWPGGVALVNNGFIIGMGGDGGNNGNGGAGGNAISLGVSVTITNNSYIAGGGAGGVGYNVGFYDGSAGAGGGGGAGGGNGAGSYVSTSGGGRSVEGGSGGQPGQAGNSGGSETFGYWGDLNVTGGSGGGRILTEGSGGAGGSASYVGGADPGGSWGSASGGAAGGKAVALNGFSVTWVTNGTRYGAIS